MSKQTRDDFDEVLEEFHKWYELKTALMEQSLGKEHDLMHSIIPFYGGGLLHLYYFDNGGAGTAIATKDLTNGSIKIRRNDVYDMYELVMFSRLRIDTRASSEKSTDAGRMHAVIGGLLNGFARYSEDATLNPGETAEIPEDIETLGGRCLIFDGYAGHCLEDGRTFGLLAIIEIFRSEMEFAQQVGGDHLLRLLKKHGHYPFSDTNREPVA